MKGKRSKKNTFNRRWKQSGERDNHELNGKAAESFRSLFFLWMRVLVFIDEAVVRENAQDDPPFME